MPPETLSSAAAQLAADLTEIRDREERAARVAAELRTIRPDTTARGRARAAAKAVGTDAPPTTAQVDRALRRPSRRRRSTTTRALRRARARTRKIARRAGQATLPGLVAQALGLVALYFVLRNANAVATVAERAVDGLEWLRSTEPIPGGQT